MVGVERKILEEQMKKDKALADKRKKEAEESKRKEAERIQQEQQRLM